MGSAAVGGLIALEGIPEMSPHGKWEDRFGYTFASFPASDFRRPAGSVAQLVEQRTENPCVGGSIPPRATITRVGPEKHSKDETMNSIKLLIVAISLNLILSGCASIQSAYSSTVDTVSGWFKSDEKKDQKK